MLAGTLSQRLEKMGLEPQVNLAIVEFMQAGADQIRLGLDGGWPWETVKTEWKIYEILHPEARFSHRVFKFMILLGALVTTPRTFYSVQRALSQSSLYRRARARWLPVPEMEHIQKDWRGGM
jgi:hypothetical protein